MPILENRKWELFAQKLAAGATLADAYLAAGYNSSTQAASSSAARLMQRACVRERVEELQAEQLRLQREEQAAALAAAGIDYAWLKRKGVEILETAIEKQEYAAASHTLERIARMCGVWMQDAAADAQSGRVYIFSDRPITEEEAEQILLDHGLDDEEECDPDDPGFPN